MALQKRDKVFASLLALLALLALGAFVGLVAVLPIDWTLRERAGSDILMGLFVAIVALLFSSVGLALGYWWGRWATLCLSCLIFILFILAGYEFVHLLFTWSPNIPSTTDPARAHLGMWLGVFYAFLGMITCSLTFVWLTRLGRRTA